MDRPTILTSKLMQELIEENPQIAKSDDPSMKIVIEESFSDEPDFQNRVLNRMGFTQTDLTEDRILCRIKLDSPGEQLKKMGRGDWFMLGVFIGGTGAAVSIYLGY